MLLNLERLTLKNKALGGRFLKTARPSPCSQTGWNARLRLELLNPHLVLQRGYALLTDSQGHCGDQAWARPAWRCLARHAGRRGAGRDRRPARLL